MGSRPQALACRSPPSCLPQALLWLRNTFSEPQVPPGQPGQAPRPVLADMSALPSPCPARHDSRAAQHSELSLPRVIRPWPTLSLPYTPLGPCICSHGLKKLPHTSPECVFTLPCPSSGHQGNDGMCICHRGSYYCCQGCRHTVRRMR